MERWPEVALAVLGLVLVAVAARVGVIAFRVVRLWRAATRAGPAVPLARDAAATRGG